MRTMTLAVALLAASLSRVACAADPIRIVGSFDLSGGAAEVGKDALAGTQYAIERINQGGGVLGRQVVLDYQDGGSNPQRAISQSQALLQNGAGLLMLPQSSASALAVSKAVSARAKVPACVGVSSIDDLTIKDFQPFVYSVTPNSYMEARAIAALFAARPYKRYAPLSADYAGGRNYIVRFKQFLKEMRPDVEFVDEEYPRFGATDYSASINKIVAAKPDYVFSILFASDLLTFSKQALAVGFFEQVGNHFASLYDFNTLRVMGPSAPVGTEGYQRAATNYLNETNKGSADFIAQFKAQTGNFPSDWTIMTYDCVVIWAQAVKSANTFDSDAVMRAIEDNEFQSARGSLRFAKYDHQGLVPTYFGKVEQSQSFGQPVLAISNVLPGDASHPTEAEVMQQRTPR